MVSVITTHVCQRGAKAAMAKLERRGRHRVPMAPRAVWPLSCSWLTSAPHEKPSIIVATEQGYLTVLKDVYRLPGTYR